MAWRFDNLDASESAFAERALEHVRTKTYDIKRGPLKAREYIPVDTSVPNGAEVVRYRQYDSVGLAKLLASYADDIPRADVLVNEFTTTVKGIATSYGFSVQELRSAMQTGTDLDTKKAAAARRATDEKMDSLARTGDSGANLKGFLNQSNTTAFTVPNGQAGTATFATKTPDEVVKDLHGIAKAIVESTKENEIPDTLLLPLTQYGDIATRRMGDANNTTILKFFLETSPYIKTVAPWSALTGAGAGPSDRMVCYRKDPDAVALVIPQEFEQFPPQAKGLEIVTYCHARCGGVVAYYPMSMAYGDGI